MEHAFDINKCLLGSFEQTEMLVALFDAKDTLRYANAAYRQTFLRGLELPTTFPEVLRHGFRNGFGVRIDCQDVDTFLADVLPRRRTRQTRTVLTDTLDGRWLQFTESLSPNGSLLTVAADITDQKQRELRIASDHASAMRASLTDPLTGVANRRQIIIQAEMALAARRASDLPVSFVAIDLDRFKVINDTFGHQAGDEVLKHFCAQSLQHLRPDDAIGRLGGEEFLLLLPGADTISAQSIVERLRKVVFACGPTPYTFSAGIAQPVGEETVPAVLKRADNALYAAKRAGRNCSVIAER